MNAETPSIFYQHTVGLRFPIPLMAFEVYSVAVTSAETDNDVYDVFITVLTKHCGVTDPSEDDIAYLIERITTVGKELGLDTDKDKDKGKPKTRSFGTSFMEYLHTLKIDSAVLKMVNYDVTAATKLYCELDRDSVMRLVAEYFSGKAEENLVRMEASMYGNGGKYQADKGSQKGAGKAHDISTPEGFAQLKSMGF